MSMICLTKTLVLWPMLLSCGVWVWCAGCANDDETAQTQMDAGIANSGMVVARDTSLAPPRSLPPKFCAVYRDKAARTLRAKGFDSVAASHDSELRTGLDLNSRPAPQASPLAQPAKSERVAMQDEAGKRVSESHTSVNPNLRAAPGTPDKTDELWLCREGRIDESNPSQVYASEPWLVPAAPTFWVWWYGAPHIGIWSLQLTDLDGKNQAARLATALYDDHIRLELSLLRPMQSTATSDIVLRATPTLDSAPGVQDSPLVASSIRVRIAPGMAPPH